MLCSRGFAADSLHGDKAQASRSRVLDRFRSGHIKVLVATDVAGRGLDVKVNICLYGRYDSTDCCICLFSAGY